MNKQVVKHLLELGESEVLEFASGDVALADLGKTICAFANSNGGTIIIGASHEGEPLGVSNAEELKIRIQSFIRQSVSPSVYITTVIVDFTNILKLIVIDTPRSVELPYTFGNSIFIRQNNETIEADSKAIQTLIKQRHQSFERWEKQLALGESINSLDVKEILKTAEAAKHSNMWEFENSLDPEIVLNELSMIEGDTICNGALILFGNKPARRFPQSRIRAVRYQGTSRDKLLDNRIFEGCAFKLLKKTTTFLETHIPIQSEIPKRGLVRNEHAALPFPAIREALLNAIVHRDYSAPDGGIIISVYSDKIEIWNSGSLPEGVSPNDLKFMTISRPPNPNIAHVLLLRGYMERVGSGIQRILRAFTLAGLPEPQWRLVSGGVQVILRWESEKQLINPRQQQLLNSTESGESVTVRQYITDFAREIKERQARTDLKTLVELGFLAVRGKGPSTEYVRTEKTFE